MSYTIKWRKESDPLDKIQEMVIGENPEKLTIASGVTDPEFNSWRVVDTDRSGKELIFTLRPQSHMPNNPPDNKSTTHR
ncbi:MAG: hypothetical protein AAB787_02960 [Patescibacteria group bacterium]